MNYNRLELLDRLASEYVLGTLRGAARKRFERLLMELPEAREAVHDWENRLVGLAEVLPPEEPGNHVWQHIEQRVFPATPTASRGSGLFWRGWALLASIGLIVMSTLFITQVPPEAQREVAFVNEENAIPLWVISMNFDTGELTTQAVSAQALELDQVYQLWMLPEQGDPQSLGIMPVNGGRSAQTFSPALLDILANAKGLAVSIEPPGGSPIATPSGPVVYQAPLTKL